MIDFYDNGPEDGQGNIKPVRRSRRQVERAVAIALEQYTGEDGKEISKVTASGYGALAEQILDLAFKNGVQVREDRDLAQMLAMVEVDSEIPSEALIAVAEILSYIYKLNAEYKERHESEEELR